MPPGSVHAHRYDELTGLPNRSCIEDLARAVIVDAKSDLVVVLIDLPDVSDEMRKSTAQRLRAGARGDDVVARISADRFAMLLTPRLGPGEEERLLTRLRTALGADPPGIAATFGIARSPEDGTSLDDLLACASQRLRGTAH